MRAAAGDKLSESTVPKFGMSMESPPVAATSATRMAVLLARMDAGPRFKSHASPNWHTGKSCSGYLPCHAMSPHRA
jgi:hypothetical protein